jgi:hypothetical protein
MEAGMHVVRVAQGMAVALGLLAAIGVSGCTAGSAPVAATASQPASLAASAPAATVPSGTASAPAATSSAVPTASGAVMNLLVSAAVRSELLTAYAAYRNIPVSDVQGVPGSVYYADQPATGTYWAKALYGSTSGDSLTVQVGFQDGGSDAFYKKTGSGPWQVAQAGEPGICAMLRFFPQPVLAAWSQPTSAPASVCGTALG